MSDIPEALRSTGLYRRTLIKSSAAAGIVGLGSGTAAADEPVSSGRSATDEDEREKVSVKTENNDSTTVLLLKDKDPWGSPENEQVLNELGVTYEVATSDTFSDFRTQIENGSYDVIIIASDQRSDTFYSRVLDIRDTILNFVQDGGVLVAHMLTNNQGWPAEFLPDGIITIDNFSEQASDNLTIEAEDSPIVENITNNELDGWDESTHGHFEQIPNQTTAVIDKESDDSKPTYIEHPYGSGTILATEQTVEWRGVGEGGFVEFAERLNKNEIEYALAGADEQPDETVQTEFIGPSEAAPGSEINITFQVDSQEPISGVAVAADERFESFEVTDPGADTVQVDNDLILYSDPLPESVTVEFSLVTPSEPWDEPLTIGTEIGLGGGDEVITVEPYTIAVREPEQELFDIVIDADNEVVAGDTASIQLQATAAPDPVSAFQINPNEQPDHVNDFAELSVETDADTQIEDPGFVVYSEVQDQVTVAWEGQVPADATAGETFTLAGDALNEAQDRQAFSHTVTVIQNPLEKYRNDDGEIDDTGLLEAISDWRDGELNDTDLLEVISEWRDAGGNLSTISNVLSQL
jgi:hypothetical protein